MIMSYNLWVMLMSLWLCVKIDELNSLVLIYVNEFMIIGYVYELWLWVITVYMSLDYVLRLMS